MKRSDIAASRWGKEGSRRSPDGLRGRWEPPKPTRRCAVQAAPARPVASAPSACAPPRAGWRRQRAGPRANRCHIHNRHSRNYRRWYETRPRPARRGWSKHLWLRPSGKGTATMRDREQRRRPAFWPGSGWRIWFFVLSFWNVRATFPICQGGWLAERESLSELHSQGSIEDRRNA